MFTNDKKTIGLFICRLSAYYQRIICRTVANEAEQLGYNVAIFSSFGTYEENQDYNDGETNLLSIPHYEELAGIILCLDVFDVPGIVSKLIDKINENAKCPVISIRQKRDEYISILSDDAAAVGRMVEHVIDEHGAKRIYYLSGPLSMYDISCREKGYYETMKRKKMTFNQSYVYRGNLWTDIGPQAIDYFFGISDELPDAIICANDYMAISVCEELNRRGYAVPEDIIVIGFDDVVEARERYPQLTTVQVSPELFARKATEVLHQRIAHGSADEKVYYIESSSQFRGSCGCNATEKLSTIFRTVSEKNQRLVHLYMQNTFMVYRTEGVSKYSEIPDLVGKYIAENHGVKSFYLCLNQDEDFQRRALNKCPFTEKMDVYIETFFAAGREVEVQMPHKIFARKELLPPKGNDLPQVYYFNPLHYKNHCFGYAAIAFEQNDYQEEGYYDFYQSFIINIDNVLESIYLKQKFERLNQEKAYLTKYDRATDVYNQYGFYSAANEALLHARTEEKAVTFICIGVANALQGIDLLGITESDKIMKAVLERIYKNNLLADTILGRISPNDFCLMTTESSEKLILAWIQDLRSRIDELNISEMISAHIDINTGYFIRTDNMDIGVEEGTKNARLKMHSSLNQNQTHIYEKYVKEAVSFIKQNYWKEISVQGIADQLGITRTYLASCFKTHYHTTVQKYIQDYRLLQASSLLHDSDLSIKEIAYRCGFADELYFSKVFKQKFGQSPKLHRTAWKRGTP